MSDFEYRVWTTYQLTADDYGVMRLSAVTIQAASDAIAKRPSAKVQKALGKLVSCGLIVQFEHQGRSYCCQLDWQNFQRVKHPRDTMQPLPPKEVIDKCTPATRALFQNHQSIRREEVGKDFGNISEMDKKNISEVGSLARTRTRETANGKRLMANGKEGGVGETVDPDVRVDAWARELVNLYPASGRVSWNRIEHPLCSALLAGSHGELAEWEALKVRLECQKRSHQWRVKGMIPRLDRWLLEGLHLQELPEFPPETLVTDRTSRTLSAVASIMKEGQE